MTIESLPIIAVETTNVFCRPGCAAPAPLPANVTRLAGAREAVFRGFRPCLRCHPLETQEADITLADLQRAEMLRPILRAARRTRRHRSGHGAVVVTLLETPLGAVLAGATDEGLCLLEFSDRPTLPAQLETLERRLGVPLVAGRHPLLEALDAQLAEYFADSRTTFDLPIVAPGSPFQQRVWEALREIPSGSAISYEELAVRAGRPGGQRAAGTANGANRIALVIPCHRVVRKGGETGEYAGGRWRKAWLLAHEAAAEAALAASGQVRFAFQAASTPTSS